MITRTGGVKRTEFVKAADKKEASKVEVKNEKKAEKKEKKAKVKKHGGSEVK